jgi:diguanylate cyclase (GGDEF)-like protein
MTTSLPHKASTLAPIAAVADEDSVRWVSKVIQRIASGSSIGEVVEIALSAAMRCAAGVRGYAFIEHQGHRDEPISFYHSVPRLPGTEIRKVAARCADAWRAGCGVETSNSPWVFPLISRSRFMGAIVLEGERGCRLSQRARTMLDLLATQTAISLDNLILSHNEWTHLPNLSAIKPRVEEAIQRARQVAVLFIDIDDFKRVNSLVGYFGGAELLVQLAQRLTAMPLHGLLGHISGDEFVLLLTSVTDGRPNARRAARDIQDALRTPFSVRGHLLPVTVSIGVSIYPKDARSVTELFEHAACAVDVAKRAGKGCYRSFRGRTPVGLLGRAPSGD